MKQYFLYFCITITFGSLATQQILVVTGGSGYIGSAILVNLLQKGHCIICIDNKLPESTYFSSSQKITSKQSLTAINLKKHTDPAKNVCFIQADMADQKVLHHLFKTFKVQAVIHFAGYIEVGKSMKEPQAFYHNNVEKTFTLINCMLEHNVNHFIFSSSAAVYKSPQYTLLSENFEIGPPNPYGKTKYIIEMFLDDYVKAYPHFKAVSLRFFNASGALPEYDIGERHQPETHLIPLVLSAAYKGTPFHIFGTDYATFDGTCIRDYLHIYDIAQASYKALQYVLHGPSGHSIFNLGAGRGHSIKEVIQCVTKVTGLEVDVKLDPRRPGDPDILVANAQKAHEVLHWQAERSSLEEIIASAHQFHTHHK
jgi:UDP-glucose 4-epimerase